MNVELSAEATDFGHEASRAFEAAGGDKLVERVEQNPSQRASVESVLTELGAWELTPRSDPDELEAAAALCRSAGRIALPYPVAERLSRPLDLDADGLIVVADRSPAASITNLDLRWVAVTLDGRRSRAIARTNDEPVRESAFVAPLDLTNLDDRGAADLALGLLLPCWTLLGMLDRAIELAARHVQEREQFGQPLAGFQGVQFQLTDAEVERAGVDVLACYALWSAATGRPEATADALAARLAALEAADIVFRVTHQLHGAQGFCDEVVLSWLSRYSQPLRRLPFGVSGTRAALARQVGRGGLVGLYGGAGE
jgi:acyl-CoA dehydrogenase-like protein